MGWLVWRLCQMAAVRVRIRWAMRGADAGGGAPAVQFQVQLALEGAVDRFDELAAARVSSCIARSMTQRRLQRHAGCPW